MSTEPDEDLSPLQMACSQAVAEMGALKYFPSEPMARATIMRLVERITNTPEEALWLGRFMVDRIGTWEGPVALRGVFCSKYRPKDGIEEDPPPGLAAANEMRHLIEHEGKDKRLPAGPAIALLESVLNPDAVNDERRKLQDQKWQAINMGRPALVKNLRNLANGFATGTLEERDKILEHFTRHLKGDRLKSARG